MPTLLSSLSMPPHSLPLLAHSICPIDRPRPAAPPWCTSLAIDIKICHSFFDVLYFLFDLSPLPLLHRDGKGMEAKYFIFSFLFLYKEKVCPASRALDGHPRWSLVVCRLFILHFSRHFILGYLRCRARGQPQKCGDGVANQASAGNNFDQARRGQQPQQAWFVYEKFWRLMSSI